MLESPGTSKENEMKLNRLGAFTLGVVVTAAFVGVIPYAYASGDAAIKVCANKKNGAMRYITKGSCTKTETALSWNQMGLQGVAGIPGATGGKGDTGAKGDTGTTGVAGAK